MSRDDPQEQLVAVLARAYEQGSPIAYPGSRDAGVKWTEMADLALRRWESFERRSKKKRPNLGDRIEDLAKGLRDAYERERQLAGPLIEDYRYIAGELATVLERLRPDSP